MRPPTHSFPRAALQFANRIVRPLDALAVSRKPGSTTPIMVTGLPRSGTTLTYELLVQAFEAAFLTPIYNYAYGLPNIVTRLVANRTRHPVARYASRYGRIPGRHAPAENSLYWGRWFATDPELGHHTPHTRISADDRASAAKSLASISAIAERPYIFKNVYLALSIPAFLRLVPDARVIVVRRDIRPTIASVYRRRREQSDWWSLRPPFAHEVRDRSILEQSVFQCVRSEQLMDATLEMLPDAQCLTAQYEAVCAAPGDFIGRVADWVRPDFERRSGVDIPDEFQPSTGPELSAGETRELDAYLDSLIAGRDRYLARVDQAVQ